MPFLNSVQVLGNLGDDPQLHHAASGTAVLTLNLASNESWTNRESGDKQEHTEWHRVVMFGKQAENVAQYARKGHLILVQGKLRTRKYETTQKQTVSLEGKEYEIDIPVTKYITEVISDRSQLLSKRSNVGGVTQADGEEIPPMPDDSIPF